MSQLFDAALRQRLANVEEVEIETQANADTPIHHTIIWVVVAGDAIYVRSFRGATARWYREISANPDGALYTQGQRIPIHAAAATNAATITRVSDAYRQKYADSSALHAMVREEILETTLRLDPR